MATALASCRKVKAGTGWTITILKNLMDAETSIATCCCFYGGSNFGTVGSFHSEVFTCWRPLTIESC